MEGMKYDTDRDMNIPIDITNDTDAHFLEIFIIPYRINDVSGASWKDGKITEERLFYDLVGMLVQIGAIPTNT